MITMIMIGRSRFIGTFDQMGTGPDGGVVTTGGLVVATVVTSVTVSCVVGMVVTLPLVALVASDPLVSEDVPVPDFRTSAPDTFVVGTAVVVTGAL